MKSLTPHPESRADSEHTTQPGSSLMPPLLTPPSPPPSVWVRRLALASCSAVPVPADQTPLRAGLRSLCQEQQESPALLEDDWYVIEVMA